MIRNFFSFGHMIICMDLIHHTLGCLPFLVFKCICFKNLIYSKKQICPFFVFFNLSLQSFLYFQLKKLIFFLLVSVQLLESDVKTALSLG